MTYAQPRDFEYQSAPHSAEPRFVPLPFLTSCEHTQRRLNKEMTVRHFEAGQTLQIRGRCHHRVHVILQGTATLSTSLPDGRTQILRLLMPRDLVGRLGSETTRYDVTAISDVTAGSMSRHEFESLLRISPEMTRRLLHSTLRELDEAREWLLLLGRKTAAEKLASFLLVLQNRSSIRHPSHIRLPLCQFEIADLLGLTHETVSRQLAHLRDQGIIEYRGTRQVEIRDLAALVSASGNHTDPHDMPYVMQ
ncbi:Crp/Fnr family transcriptional regulator [uncultured Sulfitobacter sp.]|uniref:Crp/Fnr family transcriptional regulator n=1 Tax=uncultured Sulfitobacter sp. TaxID=191468 RepID=UPI00260FFAFE|nr:Crp/Fnr family transcriptional regulator [uncultured Sulfitobacter sp.]